jgi:hypothetical protein
LELGDLPGFDRQLGGLGALANQYRMPGFERWVTVAAAARSLLTGAFGEAEELARQALAIGQERGDLDAPSAFAAQVYQLRWDQGRLAELEGVSRQMAGSTPGFPAWRAALTHLAVEVGHRAEARAEFNVLATDSFAGIQRDRFWTVTILLLSQVCAALGDAQRATILYDLLRPFASRTGVLSFAHICTGSNERVLGVLSSVMGRWEDAAGHFERALVANERLGAAPSLARTQVDYGRMLIAKGTTHDASRIRALLADARGAARELGMRRLEQDAVKLSNGLS